MKKPINEEDKYPKTRFSILAELLSLPKTYGQTVSLVIPQKKEESSIIDKRQFEIINLQVLPIRELNKKI